MKAYNPFRLIISLLEVHPQVIHILVYSNDTISILYGDADGDSKHTKLNYHKRKVVYSIR